MLSLVEMLDKEIPKSKELPYTVNFSGVGTISLGLLRQEQFIRRLISSDIYEQRHADMIIERIRINGGKIRLVASVSGEIPRTDQSEDLIQKRIMKAALQNIKYADWLYDEKEDGLGRSLFSVLSDAPSGVFKRVLVGFTPIRAVLVCLDGEEMDRDLIISS